MFEPNKAAHITREVVQHNINVLGICEQGGLEVAGSPSSSGQTILYAGPEDQHQEGVALILDKVTGRALLEWDPVKRWNWLQ